MSAQKNIVSNCGIIILAAGSSSRLGNPKQLLAYKGKTLLQHSIDVALETNIKSIIVVLGSNIELIEKETETSGVYVVKNEDWASGMASSIACGLNILKIHAPKTDGVILMVCDQPYVSTALLNNLMLKQNETGSTVVASSYENTLGTPALFHKYLFTELSSLQGDKGAKIIFRKYGNSCESIPFALGGIDIDTHENYRNLAK